MHGKLFKNILLDIYCHEYCGIDVHALYVLFENAIRILSQSNGRIGTVAFMETAFVAISISNSYCRVCC